MKWKLVLGGPDYTIGGRYVLPIIDERRQAEHFLYISASALDKRPCASPNPFFDEKDKWDGEVFRLMAGVDASADEIARLMRGGGSDILVSGKVKSIVYVADQPCYIKLYLVECVPHMH